MKYIYDNVKVLDLFEEPEKNLSNTREKLKNLFESSIPDALDNKRLIDEEKKEISLDVASRRTRSSRPFCKILRRASKSISSPSKLSN